MNNFHTFEEIAAEGADAPVGVTRAIIADGGAVLAVPGLKTLTGVRIGAQTIPLTISQKHPKDGTLTEHEEVTEDLVKLVTAPSGEQVLLRNTQSNDGMWQAGATVYVTGEWEEAGSAPAKVAKPAEGEKPTL
jgi:hypothetical protein